MVYKEKFLDPERMNKAMVLLKEITEAEGVEVALIGGVAMQVYGSPRLTKDVDVVASAALTEIAPLQFVRPIRFGGGVFSTPDGIKLDVIVREDSYEELYREALSNTWMPEEGILSVVVPEYLAAMKLAAHRSRDMEDLKWLIREPGVLDIAKTKNLVYHSVGGQFAVEAFETIEDQVDIERKREERHGEA